MQKNHFESFEIYFISPDNINSPVAEYLNKLFETDSLLYKKAVKNLRILPNLHSTFTNIKHFRTLGSNCYELRVKSDNNICRFFYKVEKPNFIVIYGFTKKTQKTDKKDVKQGQNNLELYHLLNHKLKFQ